MVQPVISKKKVNKRTEYSPLLLLCKMEQVMAYAKFDKLLIYNVKI
jgi:hypothetical protein